MKKNLLYLSLVTISLLFTACGETVEKDTTASTRDLLSADERQTNASTSTPIEEIKESTQPSTTTETKEVSTETNNVQEQNSSSTIEVTHSTAIKEIPTVTDTIKEQNSSNMTETTHSTEEIMKLKTTYNIKKGETIIPISERPKIEIITNTQTGATTATLLLGEAKILKL